MAHRVEVEPYYTDQATCSFQAEEVGADAKNNAYAWVNALVEDGRYQDQQGFGGIPGGYVGLGDTVADKMQGCVSSCDDCNMNLEVSMSDVHFTIELNCPAVQHTDEIVVDERVAVCRSKQVETRERISEFLADKRDEIALAQADLRSAEQRVIDAKRKLRDSL